MKKLFIGFLSIALSVSMLVGCTNLSDARTGHFVEEIKDVSSKNNINDAVEKNITTDIENNVQVNDDTSIPKDSLVKFVSDELYNVEPISNITTQGDMNVESAKVAVGVSDGLIYNPGIASYSFETLDDTNAIFTEYFKYENDKVSYATIHEGTYTVDGNSYTFVRTASDNYMLFIKFYIVDNKITNVTTNYTSQAVLDKVGEYNATINGENLILRINNDGSSVLFVNGVVFNANLSYSDEGVFYLYAYNEIGDNYDYRDYIITFENNTFQATTYEELYPVVHEYIKTIECNGSLGMILVDVYTDNSAEATITLDGKNLVLTGSCWTYNELYDSLVMEDVFLDEIMLYLSDETHEYALSLNVCYEDDSYHYHGTYYNPI